MDIQKEYDQAQNKALLEKKKEQINVPPQLRSPHHLVSKTILAFENANVDEIGRLIPRKNDGLHIRVSPKMLNRSLRIMDKIIKICRRK